MNIKKTLNISRYIDSNATEWNAFVAESKNGTFLFDRGYMDYHKERFHDHSLIFRNEKGKIIALLPANESKGKLFSHQGLTYGGLILTAKTSLNDVMIMLKLLREYLSQHHLSSLLYKQIPTIYHRCPSEEDDYALWRNGARLSVCNIATTIPLHSSILPPVEKCRRRRLQQANAHCFHIEENASLEEFWPILEESLMAHHNAKPIHTLQEMQLLHSRFPKNIKCMLARRPDNSVAGGVVLYVTDEVVHIQYGHASLQGYEEHVMEFIYFSLIEKYRNDGHTMYLDFGTSNEDAGRYLNENLVAQKEGFGGRSIAYKQYIIEAETEGGER